MTKDALVSSRHGSRSATGTTGSSIAPRAVMGMGSSGLGATLCCASASRSARRLRSAMPSTSGYLSNSAGNPPYRCSTAATSSSSGKANSRRASRGNRGARWPETNRWTGSGSSRSARASEVSQATIAPMLCPNRAIGTSSMWLRAGSTPATISSRRLSGGSENRLSRPGELTHHNSTQVGRTGRQDPNHPAPAPAGGNATRRTSGMLRGAALKSQPPTRDVMPTTSPRVPELMPLSLLECFHRKVH